MLNVLAGQRVDLGLESAASHALGEIARSAASSTVRSTSDALALHARQHRRSAAARSVS